MTTAHEQYYSEPDAGAIHITWDAYERLMRKTSGEEADTLTLHEQTIYSFADEHDAYICRSCGERKGWHSYWGGEHGSDSIHWEGDFHVIDEEGLDILCDQCFDEITAEPEYEEEPIHDEETISHVSPYTRAMMTVIDSLFKKS